jgi:Thiol-disulfide isomerase and thioredoxins
MTEDSRRDGNRTDAANGATPDVERRKRGFAPSIVVFGLLVAAAATFGLYEIARPPSKNMAAHSGACAKSLDLAQTLDPLVHGEIAALSLATKPNALDSVAFDDANGMKTTVASFKGRVILLNLWATWCVPCRTEMPSLAKLQDDLGSKSFSVVPVNIDTARLDKAKGFFKEIGATKLPYYSDSTADILQVLKRTQKIVGLPTTILIGGDGCEIATMAGPAQWDSPDAKALIERLQKAEIDAGTAPPKA